MNSECTRVREILHTLCDENQEMPEDIKKHMKICADCKELWASLASIKISLAEEIDEKLKKIPPPDFAAIYKRANNRKQNRIIPALLGIAAVFIFSLGVFTISLRLENRKNSAYLVSNVELFVSDILSGPILYDDTYNLADNNPGSQWFTTDLFLEDTPGGSFTDFELEFYD